MRRSLPANNPVPKRGRSLPRFFFLPALAGQFGYALLVLLLALSSCRNTPSEQLIVLENGQSFRLLDSETIATVQAEDLQFFERHFHPRSSEIQMPIYRIIRHPDYTLFLALPLQTSVNQWMARNYRTAEPDRPELEQVDDHILGFWTADSLHLAQYARHADDRVRWVLCGASPDSAQLRGLLHPDSLALRSIP